MAPTYYVIELSARWLTVLLVVLAVVMVLAFAFGYGAAWSVLSSHQASAELLPVGTPAPVAATPDAIVEQVIDAPTLVPPTRTPATTALPTSTPAPSPTRVPPTVTAAASAEGYWVQVLASSTPQAMEQAEGKLAELGFPSDHRRVITTQVAGGSVLYKLRVGPFPDRDSADRVMARMRVSGFPDAWIVAP